MKLKYKIIKLLREDFEDKEYLAKIDNEEKYYVMKQIIIKEMTDQEKREAYNKAVSLIKLDHPNIIKFK